MKFLYLKKENLKEPKEFLSLMQKFKIELIPLKELNLSYEEIKKNFEGILVLGGDGTLLRAVPYAYQWDLPILGVNMGKFGFLTEITLLELPSLLEIWKRDKIKLEERTLLEVQYKDKSHVVLNEASLLKGPLGKIISLKLEIMEEEFIEVYGDGLIISTPTGSTAYNLSAGGPVVHPKVLAFIITPICSFKINHRPFLIPDNYFIKIKVGEEGEEIHLLLDGQENWLISPGSEIRFKKAKKPIKLVSSLSKSYFQILKEKFSW